MLPSRADLASDSMKKIKIKPQEKKIAGKEFDVIEYFNLNKTRIINFTVLFLAVIAGLYAIGIWQENKKSSATAIISQASGLFSGGKYDAALSMYKQFVKDFPKNSLTPSAFIGMAYCYEELGNINEAKKAFSEVKARFPNSPWTEDAVKGIERLK